MILLNMADFQGKNRLFLVVLQPKHTGFLANFQGKNAPFKHKTAKNDL